MLEYLPSKTPYFRTIVGCISNSFSVNGGNIYTFAPYVENARRFFIFKHYFLAIAVGNPYHELDYDPGNPFTYEIWLLARDGREYSLDAHTCELVVLPFAPLSATYARYIK